MAAVLNISVKLSAVMVAASVDIEIAAVLRGRVFLTDLVG